MKTHLVIYDEADYLQAHMTVIVSETRGGSPILQEFKKQVRWMWRKWVVTAAGAAIGSRQPRR
jgi:hypothetical protein